MLNGDSQKEQKPKVVIEKTRRRRGANRSRGELGWVNKEGYFGRVGGGGRSSVDKMNNCPGVMAETPTYPQCRSGSTDSKHLFLLQFTFMFMRGCLLVPPQSVLE